MTTSRTDAVSCETKGTGTLCSATTARGIADAVVKRAGNGDIHRLLLDIWQRIERDKYLIETMRTVEEAVEHGRPYWDLCCALAAYTELYSPKRYLEIGVRQGRSAAVVAAIRPEVDLYLFDMWHPDYAGEANPGPEFVRRQLKGVGHLGQTHVVTGRSQETIPAWFADGGHPQTFPLITVDGDHRDEGARTDLDNVVGHLAPGGMLAFDDIAHGTYPTLGDTWRVFLSEHPDFSERENTRDASGTAIAIASTSDGATCG